MTFELQKLALFAKIFEGAILISLIFLGIQFKENANATRSTTATAMNATVGRAANNKASSFI